MSAMAKQETSRASIVTTVRATVTQVAPLIEDCRARRRALDEVGGQRGSLPADLRAARMRRDNARQQAERQRAAASARRVARVAFDEEPLTKAEQDLEAAQAEVERLEDLDSGIAGALELLRDDLDAAHDRLGAALRPVREQLQQQAVEKFRRARADLRDAAELLRAIGHQIADTDFYLPPIERDATPFQLLTPSDEVVAIAEVVRAPFYEQDRSLRRLLRL